ncbi:hypothetical protein [Burkholderia pseudomallei]|uniref:hypothetical protein n=1 Tax=Burkholderia pseudomallei TaxID=28450 RepID=UPI00117804E2|nr:hypothetical protein [Burkholderia pseudomallei]MBD2956241.1 hypothetical protein [Burkholderia pseudomallei]MBD2974556.1 hypothetical protein [Burkholderia pseudomallei]MBF3409099.1 hypothetical protein [Burkholderia pseudomallei]MBF3523438.1 hypothetical protein [Burkholderia pseudomallei]MBF3575178.1 hypothetical protein [Burkholderia pseudomallei]
MQPEFETIEEFAVDSEIADTTVRVRLRRQINHKPTRLSRGPFWLDLHVGSVHVPHYGVDEQFAREAAARFLLQYVDEIAPRVH